MSATPTPETGAAPGVLGGSPRRLILHAGMYKTGSTSIQHFCMNATLGNTHYFRLGRPNHSRAFKLLFGRGPEDSWFRDADDSADTDRKARRAEVARKIRKQIRKSPHAQFMFSCEKISAAGRGELVKCRKFFSKHVDDIDVYLYYRNPFSFAASRLQQRLKFGVLPSAGTILPHYRDSIEPLDNAFGVLNVHVRGMERALSQQSSIVTDFTLWTGIETEDDTEVQRNTSFSAAATALLFLYQKTFAPRIDSLDKRKDHNAILQKLRNIRGGKLALGAAFFHDQGEAIAKDCAWLATRTGDTVTHRPPPPPAGAVEMADFDALDSYGREVFAQITGRAFDQVFPPGSPPPGGAGLAALLPEAPVTLPPPAASG